MNDEMRGKRAWSGVCFWRGIAHKQPVGSLWRKGRYDMQNERINQRRDVRSGTLKDGLALGAP